MDAGHRRYDSQLPATAIEKHEDDQNHGQGIETVEHRASLADRER
jgi:hypothetical protein